MEAKFNIAFSGQEVRTTDVDLTTGNLRVYVTGSPTVKLFIWLDATGQFPNT